MMNSTSGTFDVFICIHRRDVNYLLETVLRSYQVNFVPKGQLFLVTNDMPYLKAFMDRIGMGDQATIFSDDQWLSRQEKELPGWYRQQVIKLRAYEFCTTPNFCNLGADTVLLQPITDHDLVDHDFPVLYYTPHLLPDNHFRYEQARVRNVARLLKVNPTTALRYVDFINDLFCFHRESLIGLNNTLGALYGLQYYATLLHGLKTTPDEQNKFGEWTLYSVYLLDYLKRAVTLRSTGAGFLYQVHSKRRLPFYQFNTKVVHFVSKDFDVEHIKERIRSHGLALAKYF